MKSKWESEIENSVFINLFPTEKLRAAIDNSTVISALSNRDSATHVDKSGTRQTEDHITLNASNSIIGRATLSVIGTLAIAWNHSWTRAILPPIPVDSAATSNATLTANRHGLLLTIAVIIVGMTSAIQFDALKTIPHPLAALLVLVIFGLTITRRGLISPESFAVAFLSLPAFIPTLAMLLGTDVVTLRTRYLVYPGIHNQAVALAGLGLLATFAGISVAPSLSRRVLPEWRGSYETEAFAPLGALVLTSAYLTSPGPTILTVDYNTVIANYYSWAAFAGSLFVGSWIVAFLLIRRVPLTDSRWLAFASITLLSVGWLLLHARRNEALGVMAVLLVFLYQQRASKRLKASIVVLGGVAAALLAVIGEIRGAGGMSSLFVASTDGLSYVSFPGGAHNIYGTLQATIALVGSDIPPLFGGSLVAFMAWSIPSGVWALLGIAPPPLFNRLLGEAFPLYNGGLFFPALMYANLGAVGVVFGGVVIGLAARWAHTAIGYKSDILAGLAAVFIASLSRVLWYKPVNFSDFLLGFVAAGVFYLVVERSVSMWQRFD